MPRKKAEPQALLGLTVNGHSLNGEKRAGLWTFDCPSWPDLAAKYKRSQETTAIMTEFMERAMASVRHVTERWSLK